ncbi:MAG TPA: MarR family transcriptional regulator, partial [Bacillota bacterium]|nr:MarR family transcriptional regulator [Bacillota bacterium]
LLGLFTEVNALAIQLKKTTPLQPDGEIAATRRNVLQVLAQRGPLTVPRIARLRATSRQNTQILVNRLVREGYLELQPNPDHKRSALVQLTAAGRALLETANEREAKSLAGLGSHLTPVEVRSTAELLGRLRRWLKGEEWEVAPAVGQRRFAKPASRTLEANQPPVIPQSAKPSSPAPMSLMPPENQSEESELPLSLL